MGNCMKSTDPLTASLPKSISIDTTAIKESGVPIIFVIGGPGAGKRTLCMKVAEKYGFDDIISSDVIRTEVSKRTGKAFALARLLSEGQLVPSAILVELIAAKMLQHVQDKKGFIVSGFPREKCQAKLFDKEVRRPNLVLMLNVRNSVMSDRLMAKSVKATERLSINFEYIKKQIEDFHKRNKLIVKYYRNLVVVIDAEPDTMTVFEKASESIDNILVEFPGFEANRPATLNAARSRVTSK
ncbi:adenylate kinase isoenzyme 1-like isoform X2 [Bombus vosnesenskii]|uniref:Adenylate kinase isoenzyme 1-like isoform X2 n=2 Tax=Bombus vosnesenskii TaxID=207650 RepID=A0A6J3L499_9HYME|nr:adenylate kinase isoenzyme 1-like isoform X2 [Bombus vosnesenskii]